MLFFTQWVKQIHRILHFRKKGRKIPNLIDCDLCHVDTAVREGIKFYSDFIQNKRYTWKYYSCSASLWRKLSHKSVDFDLIDIWWFFLCLLFSHSFTSSSVIHFSTSVHLGSLSTLFCLTLEIFIGLECLHLEYVTDVCIQALRFWLSICLKEIHT
jgi:hypothetical protein